MNRPQHAVEERSVRVPPQATSFAVKADLQRGNGSAKELRWLRAAAAHKAEQRKRISNWMNLSGQRPEKTAITLEVVDGVFARHVIHSKAGYK
jgi:hypothetical protein